MRTAPEAPAKSGVLGPVFMYWRIEETTLISNEGLTPLVDAKRRMEEQLAMRLHGVAILRKKIEALDVAIGVLRSNEEDFEGVPEMMRPPQRKKNVMYFNEETVERFVLEQLKGGQKSITEICQALDAQGHDYSRLGLKRILATCPQITRMGERDQTRYMRVEVGNGR